MSEQYLAEIRMFAGNFAPRGWAFCAGQILSIAQNQALFALLGTTYGGDGRTTFALPDLRGRVPLGTGAGAGLSNIVLGETVGEESHTLLAHEMPAHVHPAQATVRASSADGVNNSPQNSFLAAASSAAIYADDANATMNPAAAQVTVNPAGGNQPHNNMQPSLGMNFIIAMEGIFPSRD